MVFKFLRVAIYVYFDEVQMPSVQDQKTQDGRLRVDRLKHTGTRTHTHTTQHTHIHTHTHTHTHTHDV